MLSLSFVPTAIRFRLGDHGPRMVLSSDVCCAESRVRYPRRDAPLAAGWFGCLIFKFHEMLRPEP